MAKFLPPDWGDGYPNVWLGVTAESQAYYNQRWPILAKTPAIIRFVSAEPLLGKIDIGGARPDWVISGGESGHGFRPLDMDAVRSLRDQCARNGVAFHHKQNGGIHGKASGCLIDGLEHKHFPHALAA